MTQAKGIMNWSFLQHKETGQLIRMPGTAAEMLVIGRQHCQDDPQVSRCGASVRYDGEDGTWKLRFSIGILSPTKRPFCAICWLSYPREMVPSL